MEEMIAAREFCTYHNVDYSFISSLNEYGIIQIDVREQQEYIPLAQLPQLEKLVRLHIDLDINVEGIEVINDLLQKVEALHEELHHLKSRLSVYENS